MTMGLNFFTKHHSTRVIYRLTVQTLPDGRRSRLSSYYLIRHRHDRLILSGWGCELGIKDKAPFKSYPAPLRNAACHASCKLDVCIIRSKLAKDNNTPAMRQTSGQSNLT